MFTHWILGRISLVISACVLLLTSAVGAARVIGGTLGSDVIAYEVVRDTFRIVRNDVFLIDLNSGRSFNLNQFSNARLPPVFSPDGSHLAFIDVQRGGGGEIFVADWTGRNVRNISNHSADDAVPTWSHDGQQLAFMSRRNQAWQLFIADIADNTLHESAEYSAEALLFAQLAWSPDNAHILFVDQAKLHVIEWATGRRWQVTTHDVIKPVWSPDGTAIAYGSANNGNNEVYVVEVDGSNLRNLSDHPLRDLDPVWSPDGRQLVYISGNSLGRTNIFIVDADGSPPRNLSNHVRPDLEPAWSPDSTRVAFTSLRNGPREIFVVRAEGGGAINMTDHPAEDGLPIWSPDGEHLLFVSTRDHAVPGLYIMDADGSNPRRLADATGVLIDVLAWRQ